MDEDLDFFLQKAKAFHGDICMGIVIGTRLTLAGMRSLGMDPAQHHRDLIAFVEIDRCMSDAVQAITSCSLGHRTLKYLNYGKFGVTFYDLGSGRAVRVSRRNVPMGKGDPVDFLKTVPEEELIKLEEVKIHLDDRDLPGRPQQIDECSRCGELIFDGRGVDIGGDLLCQACASGAYYEKQ